MAFLRTANAIVVKPQTSQVGWSKVRTAANLHASGPSDNLVAQASEILGTPFDPKRYLLSHVTIVASVDTEPGPNIKLGSVIENGQKINRKYADYRITGATDHYANSNLDAFSRGVLLKSYKTFVGGENFVEHVQDPLLSKGKILDAVPRDVGDSVYIDILVATDKKHTQLVQDIISGKMSTLSMGASVSFTICTKCGNVAVDETEFCFCVRHNKGNVFLNDRGERCRTVELCGYPTEENGGVHFIEASWVATPAFTGAVLRNILNADHITAQTLKQAQQILSQPPKEWVSGGTNQKRAALSMNVQAGDQEDDGYSDNPEGSENPDESGDGGDTENPDQTEQPEAAPEKPSPMDNLEDDVLSGIVDRVHKMVIDDLDKKIPKAEVSTNDTIKQAQAMQKQATDKAASVIKSAYRTGLQTILRTAKCDAEIMDRVASLDQAMQIQVPRKIYRIALQIGAISQYSSEAEYHTMCLAHFSPENLPTPSDIRTLVRLGKILTPVSTR